MVVCVVVAVVCWLSVPPEIIFGDHKESNCAFVIDLTSPSRG